MSSKDILRDWWHGPTSTDPKDYYYKVDKRGRKFYFNAWQAKNNKVSKDFLKERGVNIDSIAEYSAAPATPEEIDASRDREKKYREKIRRDWEKLFEKSNERSESFGRSESSKSSRPKESSSNKSAPKNNTKPSTKTSVLQELGIHTKKEWREWLRRNHPDKLSTADVHLCARVIEEGQRVFM